MKATYRSMSPAQSPAPTQARRLALAALVAAAAPLAAQDSVSKTGCLPGDATAPHDTTEQCDDFTIDLTPVITSWGNTYGIAPMLKSGVEPGGAFFNSLMSAQGMSRRQALGNAFQSATYDNWNGAPGTGVNNDPLINDPGAPLAAPAAGHRFGVAVAEFGNSYEAIQSALVEVEPTAPGRLYVSKTVAATNGCDPFGSNASFGFGAIDEDGNLMLRADDFGIGGGCATDVSGDSVIKVDTSARSCSSLNAISFEAFIGAGGFVDHAATEAILPAAAVTLATPNIVPASVTGGAPLYIGTDFGGNFVRGSSAASLLVDASHFGTGVADHRGTMSYSTHNYAFLGNSAGTCATLGNDAGGETTYLNIFGIDAVGNVTGTSSFLLPGTVTDNSTGHTSGSGIGEFAHKYSQVPFRGGNGQIALGRDQSGNLIAAAAVDDCLGAGVNCGNGANPFQYIAVLRVNPTTGAGTWTMAGYIDPNTGLGKPILNGPGGTSIGTMFDLNTGSTSGPRPNVSAPMIDGVGNVWFLSGVQRTDGFPVATSVGLIKAVYNPATFAYELELVFQGGTVLTSAGTGLAYVLDFIEVADSNSISSGTAWSGNISEVAHLSADPAGIAPASPDTLGGLILSAEIVYNYDGDGDFDECSGATPEDPLSPDQDYQTLLYLGSTTPGVDVNGDGIHDGAQKFSGDNTGVSVGGGGTQNWTLRAGIEDAGKLYLVLGSLSGTAPGSPFGSFVVPLNFDAYLSYTLNNPNLPPFIGTLGVLGADGTSSVPAFSAGAGTLPAGFVGLTANHAYVVVNLANPGLLDDVSNPWPMAFLP